jgi:hypothetical protein
MLVAGKCESDDDDTHFDPLPLLLQQLWPCGRLSVSIEQVRWDQRPTQDGWVLFCDTQEGRRALMPCGELSGDTELDVQSWYRSRKALARKALALPIR